MLVHVHELAQHAQRVDDRVGVSVRLRAINDLQNRLLKPPVLVLQLVFPVFDQKLNVLPVQVGLLGA